MSNSCRLGRPHPRPFEVRANSSGRGRQGLSHSILPAELRCQDPPPPSRLVGGLDWPLERRRILKRVARKVPSRDAEDVVQEILLGMFLAARNDRFRSCLPERYVQRIASNQIGRFFGRARRQADLVYDVGCLQEARAATADYEPRSVLAAVARAMGLLTGRQLEEIRIAASEKRAENRSVLLAARQRLVAEVPDARGFLASRKP